MTLTAIRRLHERIEMATPATIRAGGHTLAATTRDISLGGIFIVTDVALREGTEIQVVLVLPRELGLTISGMVCCYGKVVRSETIDGQYGIAAMVERFQGGAAGLIVSANTA